jgi:hypothetical protein
MMTGRLTVALTLVGVLATVAPARAQRQVDVDADADERARTFFVAHRYPEALALYARLYDETSHPTYLRNMGRCHQMMRQPDQAIASFRAYLRDARDLDAAERSEIEGYIAEMQRLQAATLPLEPRPAPSPPPGGTSKRKVWIWTGIGLAIVGGVAAAVAIGSSHAQRLPCPGDTICPP